MFSTKNNNVTGNRVSDNNTGVDIEGGAFGLCVAGDSTGNAVSCNRIFSNDTGFFADASANQLDQSSITGNTTGADADTASGTVDADNNWWGCVAGPGNPGCDPVTGDVTFVPVANTPPVCVACVVDADCDNGDVCSDPDVCNAGVCVFGGGGDPDFDGICSLDDDCPAVSDPSQTDTDGDGLGDPCDACPLDAQNDVDGDGLCANVDNCPTVANANQSNIDGDGLGDACDPDDAPLNVTRVRLRPDLKPNFDNGSIVVRGDFLTNPPGDVFDATSGITLRVQDGLALDHTVSWLPSECVTTPSNGRIRCLAGNRRLRADFLPVRFAPSLFRFHVRLLNLAIQSPFQEPVRVTLSHGAGVDRVGVILDCASLRAGLVCREF
jgi:hypothetical protein